MDVDDLMQPRLWQGGPTARGSADLPRADGSALRRCKSRAQALLTECFDPAVLLQLGKVML